jgi:organic radical activating enzyme
MKFPWHKYQELPLDRRNTLQVFITNKCNLKCKGCFARNVMKEDGVFISLNEYYTTVNTAFYKGVRQINLLGGEPLLHPELPDIIDINKRFGLSTTIYTNGKLLHKWTPEQLQGSKLRVSLCSADMNVKSVFKVPENPHKFDANYMLTNETTVNNLLECCTYLENNFEKCTKFFVFSMRELDNPEQEFFYESGATMDGFHYKKVIHEFLYNYDGDLKIDISKRGVFESTLTLPDNKCRFANYFIGGKVIQCPYDVANLKFQKDYNFGERYCQQNNTCLMSKIKLVKRIIK